MGSRARLHVLVLTLSAAGLLIACASTQQPDAGLSDSSRYRVGDWVLYRFSGNFTPAPVLLSEEVAAVAGQRLRIDVRLERGPLVQRWVQVLTDSPENRAGNVVDELWELHEGQARRLANEHNADLRRLYGPTLLLGAGPLQSLSREACERFIAGTPTACACTNGRTSFQGRALRATLSECESFVWTHGPASFVDEESGLVLLEIEVLEHGHRAHASPLPLSPGDALAR